eukprot:TRINITY_DN657_c0_g1_i4.p1 TRINITY_DN657_c0_g1~~TRINITY_DN657_c0_g1_i4.p1  ORF type:complete len:141 (+),score=14.56 TRINITY_DN657_c0_g1_i4:298-720(+)
MLKLEESLRRKAILDTLLADCRNQFTTLQQQIKQIIEQLLQNQKGEEFLCKIAYNTLKFMERDVIFPPADHYAKNIQTKSSKDAKVYTCRFCNCICTGYVSWSLHTKGKRHTKNVLTYITLIYLSIKLLITLLSYCFSQT